MVEVKKRQPEKPNQPKEQKVKSLELFKSILATTLAIVLAWLTSVRSAQAGYIVTLQQIGPNVVATGSGPLDLTGLFLVGAGHFCCENPEIHPSVIIRTGPTSSSVDMYLGPNGLGGFGSGLTTSASSGSGDTVGMFAGESSRSVIVPKGYVSGTALSDMAIDNNAT